MNENDRALLNDMLDYSRRVQRRVEGRHFEEMALDDYELGDLLVRPLIAVGEAANYISKGLRAEHPEVPWAQIVGMRHRLVHGYREIDWQVVWEVATEDIPSLIEQLELILG